MTKEEVCKMIDHTLLAATATKAQILKLCAEAAERSFASVCVNPVWVSLAAKQLEGKTPAVCTVIGFPLGAEKSKIKALAAKEAVLDGAGEIDMVINIGAAKEGRFDLVQEDIAAVVQSVKEAAAQKGKKALVKVIVETCYLTEKEKTELCHIVTDTGADYIKTSTGFGTAGAVIDDIKLFKENIGPDVKIKAAGGIRTIEDAVAMVDSGADRIGSSAVAPLLWEIYCL